MGKSVIINQDKLLMLKETMASNGKVVSHKDICVNEAAPEVDEYEIGGEENAPIGGVYYHVNENRYDDLYNKTYYDLQSFTKQCAAKYGNEWWYLTSYMKRTHPEIEIDKKDVDIYNALYAKHKEISKLWNEEDNKEEGENFKEPTDYYDVINLAKEKYGITNNISQAGYILPDGGLLSFGADGYRDVDHRAIEAIYEENNIPIWSDEYRYNYVVDFMNHGAIRCDIITGILDMTQEPTNEQYSAIKSFVRKAVDIDIDFTDDKGNTLHSVSYSDARPQQVVADIRRYYNEGIKPQGNIQYEGKKRKGVMMSESQIKLLMEGYKKNIPQEFIDMAVKFRKNKYTNWCVVDLVSAHRFPRYFEKKEVAVRYMKTLRQFGDKPALINLDALNGKLHEGKNKRKNIIISENKIKLLKENLDLEVDSSEIDLSSFKKKDELVPSIWDEDDKLNSKIRLKLLDIADDFWDFVNLKWVKPKGVILTGSICNFNWSKYSDIDLHIIADFNEIDEKTEFVRDYLDSKKNEWNNEHNSLEIMGYKVELYVQDLDEMPQSSGIYDLEENDWISKPNPNDIEAIGMNKYQIKEKAAKIMTIIDDMFDILTSTSDSHKIEEISNDADYLWKKVKEMRKSSLEKDGEMGAGNIVYKYMRRKGYLDKLWKLRTMCYDKSNSIMEDKNIVQYITSLKNSFINEEFALDGNTEHNPYKDRWKAEREALKNFICNYGTVMQSKEDNKEGKLYKVLWDKGISQLIGYNYCLCVQWDEIKLKPKSVVYVRAMDKFTPNIRRNITFDNRGLDNQAGTWDDVRY